MAAGQPSSNPLQTPTSLNPRFYHTKNPRRYGSGETEPVIKQENTEHYPNPSSRDWKRRPMEGFSMYPSGQPGQQQQQQQQQQQADASPWDLNALSSVTPMESRSSYLRVREHGVQGGATDTNARPNPNSDGFATQTAPPQLSGNQSLPLRQHHYQQPQNFTTHHPHPPYYESPRHNQDQNHRSVATAAASPFYASTSSYYSSPDNMSLSYEPRNFPDYPQSTMMEPHQEQDFKEDLNNQHRYPSPPPPGMNENPYNQQNIDSVGLDLGDMPELPHKEEDDAPSPGRTKPIPKPNRQETKGDDGKYICTWTNCEEPVRVFSRKCEWSKHMDKHDRPYKCPAEGCEKLPGFTYSGGLLRHQREVHNLHGGPRKQLNCPHPNCKRFSGKGFSRQENLNEHLRRVHTDGADIVNGEETEEDNPDMPGTKRKRGPSSNDGGDLRREVARLRQENEELKRQSEIQSIQMNDMRQNLHNLQQIVGARMQGMQGAVQNAPQASMLG